MALATKYLKKRNWQICTERQGEEDAVATARSLLLLYDLYPATAVVLYMLSFGIGVGTVPWLLLGELCPSKVSFRETSSKIQATQHDCLPTL